MPKFYWNLKGGTKGNIFEKQFWIWSKKFPLVPPLRFSRLKSKYPLVPSLRFSLEFLKKSRGDKFYLGPPFGEPWDQRIFWLESRKTLKRGPKNILTWVKKNLEGGTKGYFDLSQEKSWRGYQRKFWLESRKILKGGPREIF